MQALELNIGFPLIAVRDPTTIADVPSYAIGANFCIQRGIIMRVTINCLPKPGVATRSRAYPPVNRTWVKDGEVVVHGVGGTVDIEPGFLMEGDNILFLSGVINPSPFTVSQEGSMILDTTFFNLSIPRLDVTWTNFADRAFNAMLGTYECTVKNVYGEDSCLSVVRECGKVMMHIIVLQVWETMFFLMK